MFVFKHIVRVRMKSYSNYFCFFKLIAFYFQSAQYIIAYQRRIIITPRREN